MKKTLLAIAVGGALSSPLVTPALSSEFEISGSLSLVSDYRFRGVSQSNKQAAIQGGFDLAHGSGFYAGTWASNVDKWANPPSGSMEIDFYTGFSAELPGGIGYDIGAIAYRYPGNKATAPAPKNNSTEYYLGLSYGIFSYKYSYAPTDWFGVQGSKKSFYQDISVEFEVAPKLTASAHYGIQEIKGVSQGTDLSFADYSVGLGYDIGNDFGLGLTYTSMKFDKTAAKAAWFTSAEGKKLYEDAVVVSISKSF